VASFVEIRSVEKSFDGTPAVRRVSLEIQRGEIFAILGPSGCGKSTLLRILSGLETPDSGEVLIEGQAVTNLPPYQRPTNMMFQSYALFPHMTVEQNIAFGLKLDRLASDAVRQRVDRMLDLVRMGEFRRRKPAQLSGGQQQRVALARSLAQEPKLLLLDEPMGALDRKLRAEMQFELAEIIRRVRVTCVMVTHDQEEAMVMADRIGLMNGGEIVQCGTPSSVYDVPNCRFVAEFLGTVNLFAGTVTSSSDDLVVVQVPELGTRIKAFHAAGLLAGTEVTVAIRPEKLSLRPMAAAVGDSSAANFAVVKVDDHAYLGTHTTWHVHLDSGRRVTVTSPAQSSGSVVHAGERAQVSWQVRDSVVLTA
jgi:putrescine transport system ATP-binding protein